MIIFFISLFFILLHLPNCALCFRSYSLVTTMELLTPSFKFIIRIVMPGRQGIYPSLRCFLSNSQKASPVWNMGERITCVCASLCIYFCVFCFLLLLMLSSLLLFVKIFDSAFVFACLLLFLYCFFCFFLRIFEWILC